MKKEDKPTKGTYTCRYCGKELASFNCDCENSKNVDIWKTKRKNIIRKRKKD